MARTKPLGKLAELPLRAAVRIRHGVLGVDQIDGFFNKLGAPGNRVRVEKPRQLVNARETRRPASVAASQVDGRVSKGNEASIEARSVSVEC